MYPVSVLFRRSLFSASTPAAWTTLAQSDPDPMCDRLSDSSRTPALHL
jgi:hypothetical protein